VWALGQEAGGNSMPNTALNIFALWQTLNGVHLTVPERMQWPFFPLIPTPLLATDPIDAC